MIERRATQRFAYDGRCWLSDAEAERFVFFADVSASGARIATLRPLRVGEQTTLRWRTPVQHRETPLSVEVVAKVVWATISDDGGGQMGVAFEEVRTPEPLSKFLESRAPR